MKKITLFSFAIVSFLLSYGQGDTTLSKDSTSISDMDQEQPIVVKYYQTTEPGGGGSIEKEQLNSNNESSSLEYYEVTDSEEVTYEFDEEVSQVEKASTLSYFDDDKVGKGDVDDDESIKIKYYQTVEPKQEEISSSVINEHNDKGAYHKSDRADQVKTLYTKRSRKGGGYGSLGVKASDFNDNTLVLAGVRAAWVINRSIGLGIDAWGVVPTVNYTNVPTVGALNHDVALVGGYGGLLFEPILFSNQVFHLIFPISTGMGWLGYQTYGDDYNFDNSILIDEDIFWYVEPSVALEINVARFCRLDMGVSKRFTQDLELIVTDPDDFGGWNYFVALKFGGF